MLHSSRIGMLLRDVYFRDQRALILGSDSRLDSRMEVTPPDLGCGYRGVIEFCTLVHRRGAVCVGSCTVRNPIDWSIKFL